MECSSASCGTRAAYDDDAVDTDTVPEDIIVRQELDVLISEDDLIEESILSGSLTRLPALGSRTVCVFLSSTFSDMSPERNALMEHVYPQLKEFCRQEYQLEFRMMDLRWGIREQSHDDHTIIEFCLREIDKCRAKSLGPNFVALIGQKYGYRPFPPTICAREFEAIRNQFVSDERHKRALELLDTWFKKNTNILPHVYVLQPISSLLPDYADNIDAGRKQKAVEEWESINNQLRNILRHGVTSCVQSGCLPFPCRDKYFTSVTEYEINQGMFSVPVPVCNLSTLCFMRHITNLEDNIFHVKSRHYLDLVPGVSGDAMSTVEVDREAQSLLCALRDKIPQSLTDERNLEYFELEWNTGSETNPSDDSSYLKRFCDSFRDKMQWLISRAAAKRGPACVLDADQSERGYLHTKTVEIIQHMAMCQERSAEFRGREDTLRHLRLYIHHQQQNTQASWDDDVNCDVQMSGLMTNRPLVVYGQSGSGKTAVMAKVASLVKQWFSKDGPDPIVILRFLGTTSQSCNIRLLLSSICWQIAAAYKLDASQTLPTDYPDLVVYFNELLQMVATNDRPLIMILDGLDQLGSAHRAYSLAWLPIVLPSNVRLVVSVLRHTTHELFETLEALLPYSPMNFVLIPSLGAELSVNVVKERLCGVNRTLTPTQLEIVEKALAECSLPLYTCLVFEEVCRWSSFDIDTKLESTVDDIINTFFDRLELYHGKVFVAHTLSYLTASRDGLSDAELEDVLSLDDTVLNDVFQHWLPPLRRIPPLLIPRLLDELGRYVVRREAHGVDVIYWYHGQFIAVARRRYLCVSEPHRRAMHSTLAHYYLGTWAAGSRKPFRYSTKQLRCQSGGRGGGKPRRLEDEADRMVAQQPLFFGTESCDSRSSSSSAPGSSRPVNYNLRKLYELPFHLVESRMFTELRMNVLFNYEWLHAKLCATSLPDVLADFQMTINCLHDMDPVVKAVVSENVQLLAGALRVGGSHLSHNPDTLAFDLLGRLLHHYNDSDVIVRGDDNNNGKDGENEKSVLRGRSKSKFGASVKSLLQQCDVVSPKHSALLPVLHCFDPPTAMSLYILEGHSQMVSDMTFSSTTNELLTVSKDGTLMFWDLESGERSRSVDVSDKLPGRCTRIYMTDSNAIVVDFDRLESLAFTYDVKTGRELHICGRPRLPSPLRGFVTGNLLCRQKVLVDVNTGEELFILDDFIESKSYALCVVTPDTQGLLVGEYFGTRLFDLKRPTSGQLSGRQQWIACFPSDNQPSAIAVSSDSQRAFIGYAVDCELHVTDIDVTSCTFGQVLLKFSYRDHIDPTATSQAPPGESNCEQLFPNEITEINVCSTNDVTRVLLNICRLLLVMLRLNNTSTMVEDFCFLEQPCSTGNRDIVLTSSCFNYDGQLVLACGETYLLVWSADCGNLIHRISLHTTAGYPLAIHPSRNLVATGSTIRTAVMVWDLDKTQTSDVTDLKVYDGPVDCIAVAADARLVFIKNHHSLSSSNRNFLHFWWFGVDVWNISTGTCQSVLPFNNYGRLMQMSASPEGDRLALLLVNVSHSSHVIVFSISSGATAIPSGLSGLRRKSARQEVICVAKHEHCSEFLLSPRWNFMATVSVASVSVGDQSNSENEIRLWDLHSTKANSAVVVFKEATSPTFSMNSTYLLYIDCGRTIIAYSLTSMAPKYRVPDCNAHQLIASPANNYVVMATLLKRQHKEGIDVPVLRTALVTICDFKTRSVHRVFGVAASGLVDISADGKLAVDGHVQVFDLQTGNLRAAFETHHAVLSSEEHARKLIRLTADGRYVAWIETSQVRVGRVCDSVIVACTSTHERPTSLESMDCGYVLVVGREDGRLLTMKLVADRQLRSSHKYFDLDERRRSILTEMDGVSDTSSLKPNQRRPTSIPDKSMPAASEPVISAILRLADVPVSVIDTSHRSVNQLRDYRRSLDIAPRSTTAIPKPGNSFSAVDHVSSGHIRIDIIARSATPSPAVSRSDLTTVAMAASGSTHSIGDLFRFNGLLTSYRRLSRNSAKRSRSAVDLYRLDRSVDKLNVYVSSSDICSTMTKSCYLQTTPEQVTRSKPSSVRHSSSRLSAAKDRFRNLFRSSSDKLNRSKR